MDDKVDLTLEATFARYTNSNFVLNTQYKEFIEEKEILEDSGFGGSRSPPSIDDIHSMIVAIEDDPKMKEITSKIKSFEACGDTESEAYGRLTNVISPYSSCMAGGTNCDRCGRSVLLGGTFGVCTECDEDLSTYDNTNPITGMKYHIEQSLALQANLALYEEDNEQNNQE